MKGSNRYMKILLVFREKKIIWGNLIFLAFSHFLLLDWAWSNWARPLLIGSLNSQDMISFMITTGSLNGQDMIRILKQWRHFSGKQLCGGYCMDIMYCLCIVYSWFCKASLRICYVSLFDCKGPWMLKAYKLPCEEQRISKLDWKSTMYSVVKLSSYFCV